MGPGWCITRPEGRVRWPGREGRSSEGDWELVGEWDLQEAGPLARRPSGRVWQLPPRMPVMHWHQAARPTRSAVPFVSHAPHSTPSSCTHTHTRSFEDEHDAFLVLSFVESTSVLGMNAVEEIEEVGVPGFDDQAQARGVRRMCRVFAWALGSAMVQRHDPCFRLGAAGQTFAQCFHVDEWDQVRNAALKQALQCRCTQWAGR